jgi:hypothetical protein
MSLPAIVAHEHLDAIVTTVWEALLADPAWPTTAADPTVPCGPVLSAALRIDGAWNGTVTLTWPVPTATRAATALFQSEASDLGPNDLTDAVGEISNIVAGNVKALLPEPSTLGLPHVTAHEHTPATAEPSPTATRATYAVGEHVLTLTLTPDPHAPEGPPA